MGAGEWDIALKTAKDRPEHGYKYTHILATHPYRKLFPHLFLQEEVVDNKLATDTTAAENHFVGSNKRVSLAPEEDISVVAVFFLDAILLLGKYSLM
uniref:Uncharacterized protein n=1 Tax=Amphimedon queenslandica TaxID=400682 RepID=A0A1X7V532_AMPQE